MSIHDHLNAFSGEAPSGADPEYDDDFQSLERAARPGEERQAGSEILAAEAPDYREVARLSEQILERCHDLRAAVHYTHAAAATEGYPGLAEGLAYIRGALEGFWDSCHPELDPDDPDDMALFRVNTLRGLVDGATLLRAVRSAPMTQSQAFGRVTLRDLEVADGEREPPEDGSAISDPAAIAAAFQDTDPETLAVLAASARQALEDARAIEAVFDDKVPGQGPDLSPLARLLYKAVQRLGEAAGSPGAPEEAAGEAAAEGPAAGAPAAAAAAAPPGTINSPADAKKALERIMDYYRKHEPSSPLPILLERARRLIGADFVTIMKDMAPQGVENVYLIGGIEEDED
ncbi:type VI secretion system protein TssA [Mangrovicoccus sp. HB161399]|uniref:type VI secretion system protein TssA n=1 Tax=Mangrovicoccus sp. HB161399 TaxID=2720392 RepID=UPI0015527FA1|nr:type VI secretion system protein TssA [Mangrovicoccus sp. HB161399]